MDTLRFCVGSFAKPWPIIRDAKRLSISHGLGLVAVLSKGNEAVVVPLSQTVQSRGEYLWKCSKPCSSVQFSEDSDELAAVTKDLDVQIFSARQGKKITDLTSKSLRHSSFIDLEGSNLKSDFTILRFNKHQLILSCSSGLILSLEWNENGIWVKNFAVPTTTTFIEPKISDNKIYLLSEQGSLDICDANNGQSKHSNVNLATFLNEATGTVVERFFVKLAVSSKFIAITDLHHQIYIIDIADLIAKVIAESRSNSAFEVVDPAEASAQYQYKGSESFPTKSQHHSFGDRKSLNLSTSLRSSNFNETLELPLEFTHVTALEGCFVEQIGFCSSGLAVWYTQIKDGGIYRLYNPNTGACMDEEFLPDHTRVLLSGYMGCIDAFVSPTDINLHSCDYSKQDLAQMVTKRVGVSGILNAFQGEGWHDLAVSVPILTEGVANRHLDVIKFSFKIQVLGLAKQLKNGVSSKISVGVINNIDKTFQILVANVEDSISNLDYAELIVTLSLNHFYDLLSVIYTHLSTHPDHTEALSGTEQKITECVVNFRSYLYHPPKFTREAKDEPSLPVELQCMSTAMKAMWKDWLNLGEQEVVKQAVDKNCVPMAHTFFVVAKRMLQKNVKAHIEGITKEWVLELLRRGELSHAQKVFINMGENPLDEMKKIYLSTMEENLQDFLFGYLSNQDMLSDDEIHSGLFLRQVKQTIEQHQSASIGPIGNNNFRVTVGFVSSQPMLWRDTVWAELALNFNATGLLAQVEAKAAWNYLLIVNRPDLINLWADFNFGNQTGVSSTALYKSLKDALKCEGESAFAEKLMSMFRLWAITPEMVEMVTNADSLKFTKDRVLDHLSRFGIFCSVDKGSLNSILARFARSRNLSNVRKVLESGTSTISWSDFSRMLLKHCTQHKLAPVMFSFLADSDELESLVQNCDVTKEQKQWLSAWYSTVKVEKNPSSENLIEAIEQNLPILAGENIESYLTGQPLITLALILLGSNGNLSEALSGDLTEFKAPLTKNLVESVRRSFPVLDMILTEEAWKESQKPDVTMYELLEKESVFDITKLFSWQESHKTSVDDSMSQMPTFGTGSPYEKYAYKLNINYEYYLKQGRPSYAYCSFIVEEFKQFNRLSKKRIKQSCNIAHGIALNNFTDQRIVAACISFIEMLGVKSEKARLHVTVGLTILKNIPYTSTRESIGETLNYLLINKDDAAPKLMSLLEESLVPSDLNQMNTFVPIQNWAVAVRFSKVHNLPMPESLPKFYCKSDMWLHLVLCLDLYQYSTEQAFYLVEFMESKTIKEHLKKSFLRTSQCPTKKQQSPLKSRDPRKSLYSKIGLKEKVLKSSPTENSPDSASLLAISWSSESSTPADGLTSTYTSPATETDLFKCIISCHRSLDPPRAMLESALIHKNPFLAVLASCYETSSPIDCLGTWIVTSLAKAARETLEKEVGGSLSIWNEVNIPALWLVALRSNHVATFTMSLDVFMPENPIRTLARFIKNCAVDKNFDDAVDLIQTFKSQCQNLQVTVSSDDPDSFLMQRTWVYKTAVQLVCTALAHNFNSSYFQFKFLQALCKGCFSEYLTVEAPDFSHLLQLQECLLQTGVQLDYSALCVSRRGSEKELQACMQRLVDGCFFSQALELARIAGLPRDTIVIAKWDKALQEQDKSESDNSAFWKDCQLAFVESKIQPVVAAEFFHNHSETRKTATEKYQVLQLAYSWFCLAKQLSMRKRQDCYITRAVEVEMDMWRTRLKIGKSCELDAPLAAKLFTQTRKELFAEAGIGYIDFESKLDNEEEIKTLDDVIGELLDQGRFASALRLEALFCHKNKDLRLLVTCLSLAESEIMPYQLSSEQRLLMEQSFTPSSSFRRRPLYSLKLSSLASTSLSPGHSSSLGSEFIEVPPKEQQEVLAAIEKLADRLEHGKIIGERIAACFRVSMNIEKSYVDIITVDDPLSLLRTAITKDCLSKFAVASDLSIAGQISKEDMALYLRDEIFAALSKHQIQGGIFWGYDLDSSFHLVLELCQDPVLLGKNLLELTRPLNVLNETTNSPQKIKKAHGVTVELLIRSHDCYTAACDMEGIADVLLRARSLTANLLQQQEWQLMVRLVTGIGRYNDMIYIFKILKDHEQFEFLLGKGMDKVPGLKIALLDFVRSKCADNKELLQLVALHFRLYSEVAEIWESEAKATISRLLSVTVLDLGIAIPATKYKPKPKQPTPQVLRVNADLGHHLKIAMQNFSHAAEYYLQANKLTKAIECASQAELVALQISMTIGVSNGQTIDSLFEQDQAQVTRLITNSLSYPQAAIVVRAYNHPVDWGAAVYQHCVIQKEQKYLTEFSQAMPLTPFLVEDIARRFQHESSINSDMDKMMKQIVNSVKSVEVKYRIASQLGFKDIIEGMISGTDLPYLKDTVWRRGTKHY